MKPKPEVRLRKTLSWSRKNLRIYTDQWVVSTSELPLTKVGEVGNFVWAQASNSTFPETISRDLWDKMEIQK